MKKIIALTILFSGIVASSFAQVNATAQASANIITPISISKNVDMAFGNISVNSTTLGTVTLPATSGTPIRSYTGGVTLPAVTGTVSAAEFTVTGANSTSYAITLPGVTPLTSGGSSMNLDTFLTDIAGNTGTLSGTGTQSFYVGSTLHVAAAQAAGTYTGSFSVTVNYN